MSHDDDPFGSLGLRSIELEHKSIFDCCFSSCNTGLSDYTFANSFIWRDSIHLRWRMIHDCLCVFANGDGGLTMLFPPLGRGDCLAALDESLEICEAYNRRAGLACWTRVEYAGEDFVRRLGPAFGVEPMSGDYVYPTARMIDLAGGDLASKRQAKNRFARRYQARTEPYRPEHRQGCMELLQTWQEQTEASASRRSSVWLKRSKEIAATAEVLANYRQLGLSGMVLLADDKLAGFTFGEMLAEDTCSILVEKTDRQYAGSAQYIFSEFCRQYWAHTAWCNVGDDWDVPSLAWTKQSYRPACRIPKYIFRPPAAVQTVADQESSSVATL
jgi:hypothetical protein